MAQFSSYVRFCRFLRVEPSILTPSVSWYGIRWSLFMANDLIRSSSSIYDHLFMQIGTMYLICGGVYILQHYVDDIIPEFIKGYSTRSESPQLLELLSSLVATSWLPDIAKASKLPFSYLGAHDVGNQTETPKWAPISCQESATYVCGRHLTVGCFTNPRTSEKAVNSRLSNDF